MRAFPFRAPRFGGKAKWFTRLPRDFHATSTRLPRDFRRSVRLTAGVLGVAAAIFGESGECRAQITDDCSASVHLAQLPCDGTTSALKIGEIYDWICEVITELPISEKVIAQDTYSHLFCAGLIPCNTPDAGYDFGYIEEVKQTYAVGGSLSVTVAAGFAMRLVAKLEGTLTWNGSYTREVSESISRTAHYTLHPCQRMTVTAKLKTRLAQGTIDSADEMWTWEFVGGPCDGKVVQTFCNRRTGNGRSSRTAGVDISNTLEVCPPGSCYCIPDDQ